MRQPVFTRREEGCHSVVMDPAWRLWCVLVATHNGAGSAKLELKGAIGPAASIQGERAGHEVGSFFSFGGPSIASRACILASI